MIIIGSHALGYRISLPLTRPFKDLDIICSYDQFDTWIKWQNSEQTVKECYPIDHGKKMIVKTKFGIHEFEIAWDNSTAKEFTNLVYNDKNSQTREFDSFGLVSIPSLNALYALKMSHRYLKNSPHFLKTMSDIKLMEKSGAIIQDEYKTWFKERQKATYDYGHPKLNQNKNGFFDVNQGVTYIYDHDTIHQAMAHLEKPAYEYYKSPNAEVMCSKEDFFNASEQIRLYGVLEEAYVLALERSQIPFKDKVSPERSFLIALEKVCTSITSGWFREYAYNNYDKVMSMYDLKYVDRFWTAVESGVVKKL